jgi:hypothetical protein
VKRTLSPVVCIAVLMSFAAPATAAPADLAEQLRLARWRAVPQEAEPARATIRAGRAVAPAGAPPEVRRIIAAGNRIATRPYKYGGGHGIWRDSGYDCSGSVSYALHGAGLLDVALDSSGLAAFGRPGPGRWVSIMGNPGHAYMVVAGLRFDTSSSNQTGNRWTTQARSPGGYAVRHPAGL